MSNKKPFVVLVVEDDEHDIVAIKRAWKKNDIANTLHIVRNGDDCLDYLHRRGDYSDPAAAPAPGIVLLDIKMPKTDGFAILEQIRQDGQLRHLPVIVFSGSETGHDRARSYELGANAYVTKPSGAEEFARAIRIINEFWELADLPDST